MRINGFGKIFMTVAAVILSVTACQKSVERPAYLPDEGENGSQKEFVIYDAMGYPGRPSLTKDRISQIKVIYEHDLVDESFNVDMSKVERQVHLTKLSGIKTISLDIEQWYTSMTGDYIRNGLKQVFDKFRAEIPGSRLGNYGLPVFDLNVSRHSKEHHSNPQIKNMNEEEFIAWWKQTNEKKIYASDVCDILFPSAYIITDLPQWKKDMTTMSDFIRQKFPQKKIVAYVWPQFYGGMDNANSLQFLTSAQWMELLEHCYECFDGVILWSNGRDTDDVTMVPWSDPRVQAIYEATKQFIAKHDKNIVMDNPGASDDEDPVVEPAEFEIFANLNFTGTPDDLRSYGIQPIQMVSEEILAGPEMTGSVYEPLESKMKVAAGKVKLPVFVKMWSWIRDRQSDNAAMLNRFKFVQQTFKSVNPDIKIGYRAIGPTSLTNLRVTSYTSTDLWRTDNWQKYAVEPTRGARQYADFLCPELTIIDDNLENWKNDTRLMLSEAKAGNDAGKKIYAVIPTVYFNKTGDIPADYTPFPDAMKPIKEATWAAVLEFLYYRCDGIIIEGNVPANSPVAFSENLGIMKATKAFYESHKAVIDKKLPTTLVVPVPIDKLVEEGEVPTDPTDPTDPIEPGGNLIANGDFEENLVPQTQQLNFHGSGNTLIRPVRLTGYFETTAQTTKPDISPAPAVADGQWFHRTYHQGYWWTSYVTDLDVPYINYYSELRAHSGKRAIELYSQYQTGAAAKLTASHLNNLNHVFGIGQRISMNDTKKYELKFYYYRPSKVWQNKDNNAAKFVTGIVSSTGADYKTDFTYEQVVEMTSNDEWVEYKTILDMPAIIAANPGKSFAKAAFFVNIVVPVNTEKDELLWAVISLDDISITEIK